MALNSLIAGPGAIGSLACLHAQTLGKVAVFPHRAGISLPKTIVVTKYQNLIGHSRHPLLHFDQTLFGYVRKHLMRNKSQQH
jgi:hypothetical protein